MSMTLLSPPPPIQVPPSRDSARVDYYARSFGDPISRLFWHASRLHLGLIAPYGGRFRSYLASDALSSLFTDRLVSEVEESGDLIEGFEAVYQLQQTPRITYWHEWSPAMWRAGALRLLELLTRLARSGYTLRNPHPWNLLFDGRTFSYANAGSVVPFDWETFGRSYEKIARFFIRPLLLLEYGFDHIARRLVEDPREGVLAADCRHLDCGWAEWPDGGDKQGAGEFLERVSQEIGCLQAKAAPERWIDYFATDCDFSEGTSWTRKQDALLRLLADPGIHSVLDLGANTGHYARLAAERGREVIAADFDPALVDAIYQETQARDLPLYPVVMDFTHPAPGSGVNYRWFPAATERLGADLVLCFALAHHMVFGKYRLDFEQIARGIRSFAREWALVEYVERGKIQPSTWRPDADGWYSVDEFASALRRYFRVVEILPPATDGRQLLVCGPERRRV